MKLLKTIIGFGLSSLVLSCSAPQLKSGVDAKLESIKTSDIELRAFLQDMPKGGDLHNHLYGAVYAESFLKWAVEDGLCLDLEKHALSFPNADGCGDLATAKDALTNNQNARNEIIEALSVRDFKPTNGWSGHDQFFGTFSGMQAHPKRFGDMVAEVANRAGEQNVLYLELMHTMELFETILPMVIATPMSGDVARDYKALMDGPFGKALPDMVARAIVSIEEAQTRKDELLLCGTENAKPGCDVTVRYLHQPVRVLPPSVVYAHMIFGWHLMAEDGHFVGTNLVAPEDDFVALRDYKFHMEQIDYLYTNLGARNISLHAGELWLGLVKPTELRSHIRDAIDIGHAKRIGHGTSIVFETGYKALMKRMKDENILVEINLTSNDVILGVKGTEHPYKLYKNAGVPMSFSTDDEGVSRIDLTHEYVRAVKELGASYQDLKASSYNGLNYGFLNEATKSRLRAELDKRFLAFEAQF